MQKVPTLFLSLFVVIFSTAYASPPSDYRDLLDRPVLTTEDEARYQLREQYVVHCKRPSDINEHLPTLARLASNCSSVAEIGVRSIVSTWGLLQGLSEGIGNERSYLGIDLDRPPMEKYTLAKALCEENGIAFQFIVANDLTLTLEPVDLLFIDTLHTYQHLTAELERFSPSAKKYIVMHDTSEPFGTRNCPDYNGDYSEYPAFIDRHKKGLWRAVEDFLVRHRKEWQLLERHHNNHGLTVLKRIEV